MLDFITRILKPVASWLGVQLDKLKIANPIVFALVQSILFYVESSFLSDIFTIPTPEFIVGIGITIDQVIEVFLGLLMIVVSPRTARFVQEKEAAEATNYDTPAR